MNSSPASRGFEPSGAPGPDAGPRAPASAAVATIERLNRARGLGSTLVWAVLPAALTLFFLSKSRVSSGEGSIHLAGDFHYAFWPAARRTLEGLSPYVGVTSASIAHHAAFVYPALAVLLLAPFGLLAHGTGDVSFALLNIAAVQASLWLLGVRDWRLYGLVMLCPAVFAGWTLANVTLLLGLCMACAWRYRDTALVVGGLIALAVSVKLFLWPALLWLVVTKRYRALGWAALCGLALNLVAWTIVGFEQVSRYIHLLNAVSTEEERVTYSVVSLARQLGFDRGAAWATALVFTGLALAAMAVAARRGRELPAFALAIAASLLATPIVQLHYYALLLVPLAVARPRLSRAWALPLLMWLCAAANPEPWQIAGALALGGAIVLAIGRSPVDGGAPVSSADAIESQGPRTDLDVRLVPPTTSSVVAG